MKKLTTVPYISKRTKLSCVIFYRRLESVQGGFVDKTVLALMRATTNKYRLYSEEEQFKWIDPSKKRRAEQHANDVYLSRTGNSFTDTVPYISKRTSYARAGFACTNLSETIFTILTVNTVKIYLLSQ